MPRCKGPRFILKNVALIANLEYEWSSIKADISDAKRNGLKAAAISKYSATWPTIKTDFNHASENDLSEAAKATKHGDWYETALLAWADQRGKRIEPQQSPEIVNSVFAIAGKTHTIKG